MTLPESRLIQELHRAGNDGQTRAVLCAAIGIDVADFNETMNYAHDLAATTDEKIIQSPGGEGGGTRYYIRPAEIADGSGWATFSGAGFPAVPESGPYPPVVEKRPEGPYTATGATRAADAVSEAIERDAPILSHSQAVTGAMDRREDEAEQRRAIALESARNDGRQSVLGEICKHLDGLCVGDHGDDWRERIERMAKSSTALGIEWAAQYIRDDIEDVPRPLTWLSGSPEDALVKALGDFGHFWRQRGIDTGHNQQGYTNGLIDGSERLAATIHADLTKHGVPTHDDGRVTSLRERVGRIANNPTYQAIHKAVSTALDEIGIPPNVKDCNCADSDVRPCHGWKCRIRGVAKRADQVQAKHNAIDAHDQGVHETDNAVHKALDRLGVPRGSNRDGDGPLPWIDRLGLLAERAKESEDDAAHWKAKASGAESGGVDGWRWRQNGETDADWEARMRPGLTYATEILEGKSWLARNAEWPEYRRFKDVALCWAEWIAPSMIERMADQGAATCPAIQPDPRAIRAAFVGGANWASEHPVENVSAAADRWIGEDHSDPRDEEIARLRAELAAETARADCYVKSCRIAERKLDLIGAVLMGFDK